MNLEFELGNEKLKRRFFNRADIVNTYEDEIKLRSSAKEKINETEGLKKEVKDNEETKIFKLLIDLKYEKHDKLYYITVLEPKLIKLEIPPTQIDKIKKSILSS